MSCCTVAIVHEHDVASRTKARTTRYVVKHCPKHAAVDELCAALKEIVGFENNRGVAFRIRFEGAVAVALAALAKTGAP